MYDTNCLFPELENLWKETINHGLNEIQKTSSTSEILQKWKSYTKPLGYRLVRINSIKIKRLFFYLTYLF